MKSLIVVLLAAAMSFFLPVTASSAVMDNGVDPENLGTGQWIYFLSQATNRLGGNVGSVTDIPSLMRFYKKSGIDFVVVKSGTGAAAFGQDKPQFTKELVDAAHAEGLKIFGYTRSNGIDVPGEINLAIRDLDLGADGFVIDAEGEWESSKLKNAEEKAIQLCKGIKARYPNTFLGHAPFPIISLHRSFPYKEFGLYCDAVMPQAYWKSIKVTPTRMVEWMNEEWDAWHKSLPPEFKKAIKPIAPIGQGWSPDSDRILHPNEISEFVAALNHHPNPAYPGGYKGVSYWRTDLQTSDMWQSIRKAKIGKINTTPKNLIGQTKGELQTKPDSDVTGPQGTSIPIIAESENDFVLDNDHPNVSIIGSWYAGKGKAGRYGSSYLCANTRANGKITATAVYRPHIRTAGLYDIYIWYAPYPNRSTKAPWFISYDGNSEIVFVDQSKFNGDWHLLTVAKPFSVGTDGFVSISNDSGERESVIVADAVRFVLRDTPAATTSISGK